MRILFGGMLFYTHLVWGLNLDGFFGPNGWQGETLVQDGAAGSIRLVVLVVGAGGLR